MLKVGLFFMHAEEQHLRDLYNDVHYDPNLFMLYISEDKYIFGYMSEASDQNPGRSFFMYKTLYDTIVDLDVKIKKSFGGKCGEPRYFCGRISRIGKFGYCYV